MKMSLTENVPYNTETCTSYTLIFGPANDHQQKFLPLPSISIIGIPTKEWQPKTSTITKILTTTTAVTIIMTNMVASA
jgi:hypothetical protein